MLNLWKFFKKRFGRNACCPEPGVFGWFMSLFFRQRNRYLEDHAVRLCQIQPNYKILEVGFGPGLGIKGACQLVDPTKGGRVCGLDISPRMFYEAERRLRKEILAGKVELVVGSVEMIPYGNDTFDRVFHCNCYYFWPRPLFAAMELYRVMKPNSLMVTTMNVERVRKLKQDGMFRSAPVFNMDPLAYMVNLEAAGFTNVRIDYLNDSNEPYQAIFAEVADKKHIIFKQLKEPTTATNT